jgi:hypothetical protein
MADVMATPVGVTASALIASGPGILCGLSLRSTAGAICYVYDNTAASGLVLVTVQLAANTDRTIVIPDGVRFSAGAYFSASAAVEGSVWLG